MRNYKKYSVWQLGHEITLEIYKMTKTFPKEELYGITSQMRRATYSIPSNIVEGCGRESDAEFRRFLIISQGSASELEYFTILVHDLEYINNSTFEIVLDKVNKIRRSLNNLIHKIQS
ncbi:four helix bundle protein [Muricauda sp. SCSIO 64092]|uniref:four helix bundle protein n=1 Tax=Allomuricauda sp. SCSIO 64092 TaxID=2908842 RepID=UPI001FF2FF35|nr:four helix bundle protein [Muricauda sp. SCSIO 64092]UOY06734.1 four helix bundle protein [Muricauda sp. SCSIO 64092]